MSPSHRSVGMFGAVGELDRLCARLSAQHMSALERKKLKVLPVRSKEAISRDDCADYAGLNEEFHDLTYQGVHSTSLRQINKNFGPRLALFRVSILFKINERMQSSLHEHEEIVLGIIAAAIPNALFGRRHPDRPN